MFLFVCFCLGFFICWFMGGFLGFFNIYIDYIFFVLFVDLFGYIIINSILDGNL